MIVATKRSGSMLGILMLLGMVLLWGWVQTVRGGSEGSGLEFVVDSTVDAVDANVGDGVCATAEGFCTLRAAVQEANAAEGADTIYLSEGVYMVDLLPGDDVGWPYDPTIGDIDIFEGVTIVGAGEGVTFIDGGRVNDVLHASTQYYPAPNVPPTAEELVVLQGVTVRNGRRGLQVDFSAVTVEDSQFTDNIYHSLYVIDGDLNLERSRVISNTRTGIYNWAGNVLVNESLISRNDPPGINSFGVLTVTNSIISEHDGAAIRSYDYVYIADSEIVGNGGNAIEHRHGLFMMDNTTVHNNRYEPFGSASGAVFVIGGGGYISHSAIYDNVYAGVYVDDEADMMITASRIEYNGDAGVHNDMSVVTIDSSTVAYNGNGVSNTGYRFPKRGEEAPVADGNERVGDVFIVNSTISNNDGTGVYNLDGNLVRNTVYISSSTVAYNMAWGLYDTQAMEVHNSIIAWNQSGNCGGSYIHSEGYAVSSDDTCTFLEETDMVNINPLIGELQDNGGKQTPIGIPYTHALLAGSPMKNVVPVGQYGCGTRFVWDQRGAMRANDGSCDLGAYEEGGVPAGPYRNYVPVLMR
ncbi:MAG TPA: right-handed parallel beta-helix repeat-containing protein [Anaerolineae bacterium]|nr:right-handed parallel beta-helix repeat-containing protein [Anaerolineae bacterium]